MNLPTNEEINSLLDEYKVPANVRAHSEQVRKVSVFIAEKLREKGVAVNLQLIEKAALLHDLTKVANFLNYDLQKGVTDEENEFWDSLRKRLGHLHHADSAADVLQDRYPEVAEIVRAHNLENIRKGFSAMSWESRLFCYADARVLHDRIVRLEERIDYLNKAYGDYLKKLEKETGKEYLNAMIGNFRKLEKEIFSLLDIVPEDINKL